MNGFKRKYDINELLNAIIRILEDDNSIYSLPVLLPRLKLSGYEISLPTFTRLKQKYLKNYNLAVKFTYVGKIDILLNSEDISEKVTYIYQSLHLNNQRLFNHYLKRGEFEQAKKHLVTQQHHIAYSHGLRTKTNFI
jgi:hypothetical protein